MLVFAIFLFQLAPSLPLQEDFVYHWKAITHYYIETSGKNKLTLLMVMKSPEVDLIVVQVALQVVDMFCTNLFILFMLYVTLL